MTNTALGHEDPNATRRTILILGGTGMFGRRLCAHLSHWPDITLFVSSRSKARADALASDLKALRPGAKIEGMAIDRSETLREALAAVSPFVVVDCSGPFQSYGYETVKTVLSAGAHYIDLADARSYLAGFAAELHALAIAQKRLAVAGASSTPALSGAVVESLAGRWKRLDTVDIAITPAGKSDVGISVIEAILSYAGRDVPIWADGQLATVKGWSQGKRIDVPGLGKRRVAPVETYDAERLGPRHGVTGHVTFSAGLESRIEQFGLEALARLRAAGLVGNLAFLGPLFQRARRMSRIGTSQTGAMHVSMTGVDEDNQHLRRDWTLIARKDHGPFVPILPVAAVLRKLLAGENRVGAFLADDVLTLDDIVAEAAGYAISMRIDEVTAQEGLFEKCLGRHSFAKLSPSLRRFHSLSGPTRWHGRYSCSDGSSRLAGLVRRAFRFPEPTSDAALTVSVERSFGADGECLETWRRDFQHRRLISRLSQREPDRLTETFGPLSFGIGLRRQTSDIAMPVDGWRLGKLPLPKALAPVSEAREYEDEEGRFRFDVRISLPVLGTLTHYRGWLLPEEESSVKCSARRQLPSRPR